MNPLYRDQVDYQNDLREQAREMAAQADTLRRVADTITLTQQPDGSYLVTSTALPGLVAGGPNLDAALGNFSTVVSRAVDL